MVVFTALLLLCFVVVAISMLTDMYLFIKEVCKDGSKKNRRFKERRILYPEAGGVSQGERRLDTGRLRA
jgi:hypothetical protein